MRRIFFLSLAIGINLAIYAQALYEFELYFEDAIGNRDTIYLGSDPDADSFGLSDGIFGEEGFSSSMAWDSDFEVRMFEMDSIWQKKSIVRTAPGTPDDNNVLSWFWPSIKMHAIHLPVMMSWDSSYVNQLFYEPKFINVINGDYFDVSNFETSGFLVWPDLPQYYYCVYSRNSIELNQDFFSLESQPYFDSNLQGDILLDNGDSTWHRELHWVEYFPGEDYAPSDYCGVYNPAAGDNPVSAGDYLEHSLSINNPVSNIITIEGTNTVHTLNFFSLNGMFLFKEKNLDNRIDVSRLEKGFYIVQIETYEGILYSRKMVKL